MLNNWTEQLTRTKKASVALNMANPKLPATA